MAIGAASRQELERIRRTYGAPRRSRERRIASATARAVRRCDRSPWSREESRRHHERIAPIDGVVTERLANVGLNVDQATKLFTIVDLSSVWVVATVREGLRSRARWQSSHGHDQCLSRPGFAGPRELHRPASQPGDADSQGAYRSAERAQRAPPRHGVEVPSATVVARRRR